MNNLTLRTLTSPYVNDVTRGSVLSQADVDNNFIFLKGNIIYTAETIGNIVTLKRFNGDDLSFIAGETFTGGTISGATNFTGGLTADIFSATTYFGLPQDIYVTGGTYNSINGTLTLINNSGATFDIVGLGINGGDINVNSITANTILSTGITTTTISATTYYNLPQDIYVTGGTYTNGTALFTNNTGGTFNINGFYTGATDVYVTGGTYSNGTLTYTNNTGGTFNVYGSTTYAAGVISGASGWSKVIPNNGQINLPPIKVALFNNANNIEPIIVYDVASGTTGVGAIPSLTDNDTNYVVVEYNGGSPRYYVYDNDGVVDDSSTILYMIIYRLGNFVHTLEFGNQGAGLANKLNDRFIMTNRFGYESGLIIGLSGTGVVTLTAGVAWNGTNRQVLNQCDSSGNTFFKNYHVGGSWTATTTGNTLNNSYYDNGTDIVSGTTGKYLTNWYFRGQEINDHLYEVYGVNQYDSVSLAEASSEPLVPELVSSHAFLVGRIIVGVGETTGQTQTSFGVVFQPSGNFSSTSVHNDLTGLQGGLGGQYYHLNSSQYNNLALINVANNFTPQQTFSGGLSATTISATTYYGLPSGPISVINTSSLFSTGLVDTGYQASGVTDSNFFGNYAGYQASGVSLSNFMGLSAGTFATNAEQSNFFGFRSGYGATDANSSNFLGSSAGYGATNASQSNFFGLNSGFFASGATVSNFFGTNAGYQAYDAGASNFIGSSAGYQASGANNSNFFGYLVGYKATNAYKTNLFGFNTGYQASGANNSNFFGTTAGREAYNASNSNFLGQGAGYQASGANNSNFFGQAAGQQAYNAYQSNFIGYNSGYQASGALASIFIGGSSGYQASGSGESNFFGWYAGYKAYSAGYSTFIGSSAGREANGATFANFMGRAAGLGASGATVSNFFGYNSGYQATGASQSNFMGYSAGQQATDARFSNFIGYQSGNGASSASFSNFMGAVAGYRATGATYSNLFGYNAGNAIITSDSIGSNNIIIGTNITLSAGTIDSINIGGVLFGTGTYSAITGAPSISANTIGKIGIGVIAPTERLHVSGNLLVDGNLTFTGQSRNPIYSAGTVSATHIPNWNNSNIQTVILSATTTSISGGTNIQNGAVYTMILKQNASGSRVVTWGSEYKWQSGIAPVLSSTANAVDIITLISDGTNLYGLIAKDFR